MFFVLYCNNLTMLNNYIVNSIAFASKLVPYESSSNCGTNVLTTFRGRELNISIERNVHYVNNFPIKLSLLLYGNKFTLLLKLLVNLRPCWPKFSWMEILVGITQSQCQLILCYECYQNLSSATILFRKVLLFTIIKCTT